MSGKPCWVHPRLMTTHRSVDLPETPWEFFPDDDLRGMPPDAPEAAAMHLEDPLAHGADVIEEISAIDLTKPAPDDPEDPAADRIVVHYLDDEEPEVVDVSAPVDDPDVTPDVEDLLIRQHHMY